MVRIVDFSKSSATPIEHFESQDAASVPVASGSGDAHVYTIYFEPGGSIGRHPTGYAQLFLVVAGTGWVEGGDGVRHPLLEGQGAYFENGEQHSKGSDAGMTAVMIQVDQLSPSGR